MKKTVFDRVAELPVLAPYCQNGTSKLQHAVVSGLAGAARALAIGAIARAKSKLTSGTASIALAIVDSPDAAMDLISDLRAFVGLAELETQTESKIPKNTPSLVAAGANETSSPQNKFADNTWEDETLPAAASMPEVLKRLPELSSLYFPAWDVLPTEADRPEPHVLAGRQNVLRHLRELLQQPRRTLTSAANASESVFSSTVIVAPIAALMQPCEAPQEEAPALILQPGLQIDPIELGRKLVRMGFERTGQVEVKGEFSLRGGILDIFPYHAEQPFRIDFFDIEIDTICPFDPLTQRSESAVPKMVLEDSSLERLRAVFSTQTQSSRFASLLEHLPPHSTIAWINPQQLAQRAALYSASLVSGENRLLPFETLRNEAQQKAHTLDLLDLDAEKRLRQADALETVIEPNAQAEQADLGCTGVVRLCGEVAAHADEWKKKITTRMGVYVFCETGGDRRRLETLFKDAGILPAPALQLVTGRISAGFDLRLAGITAISDHEIFERRRHAEVPEKSKKKTQRAPEDCQRIASVFELQLGDYVVHASHGIGRYLGLARLEKNGRKEDYLTLQFADEVKLYVPAPHIDLVSKYIGGASTLTLSKLGSKVWSRKKAQVEKAIKDIAEDLLAVQAARKSLPGIVYPPDDDWQRTFEAAFPYEETPDQLKAIQALKTDMEATYPMDRLLCGDVGFGKTEVAVRAAFKAIAAGKQVAMLVPTTLLAEQHGRTFKERFAGYPVSIDTLSRFKSKKEQRALIERLQTGRLDIVIGTHRLIQKDVKFKELGLTIVDEEQRFGVEHKEFFKKLRKTVDVLTLTATPIPRTLHMSMLGLRDISNLTTPPRNRKPVITKVARVSDDLLRRAILREISRGGQVFVIHPRVSDIQEFCFRLQELVPEGRFDFGHGQLNPDALEDTMARFLERKIDVLVSTTIVESGLDIPSANTILIHEAKYFGLAELHQLRGRVGRGDTQAYCYLLLPETSGITPEGLRRLRALEEFDELGAGFKLALRDLEIRGAGNVLGAEQSGHIAEIGYDLYCKLLDETVRTVRGEPTPPEELEVNVQLRANAYMPQEYIEDDRAVLEFYRRLNRARDDREIELLLTELEDRFGKPPEPVLRMFGEAKLRNLARKAKVPYVGIDRETGRLILKLHDWDLKSADRALRGLPGVKDARLLDEKTLSLPLTLKARSSEHVLLEDARLLVGALAEICRKFGSRQKATE